MIVDASAVLAIMFDEPESQAFKLHLASVQGPHPISAVNYVEAAVRLDNDAAGKGMELDAVLDALDVRVASVSVKEASLARSAYRKFGKGNHPAKLNLGDCFAYALSKARGEPLLYKGEDFRLTDVEAAL